MTECKSDFDRNYQTDPFRDAIERLHNRGTTYARMARKSGELRSTAWFNNVKAGGSRLVGPPPPHILHGFARLFDMTWEQVAAMVAESWYGVQTEGASERVKRIAPALDALDEADAELVERLVTRLNATGETTPSNDIDGAGALDQLLKEMDEQT